MEQYNEWILDENILNLILSLCKFARHSIQFNSKLLLGLIIYNL